MYKTQTKNCVYILCVPPSLKTYIIILFFFENLYKYIFRNLLSKCEAILLVFLVDTQTIRTLTQNDRFKLDPLLLVFYNIKSHLNKHVFANMEMKAYF